MELPATLTDRVSFTLAAALARGRELEDAALAELALPARQYCLLALLEHGPVARQHELGAVFGLDRTTTAKLMRRLVDRGLVRRAPLPGNGRALVLELTPAGDALRAEAARRLAACDQQLLAPLPPADRDRLCTVLGRLVAATRSPD